MLTLGIETSCDETACSIVEDGRNVLSSIIASQVDIHAQFGGVVPEIAARQHLQVIDQTVTLALKEAKLKIEDIDVFGVTQGPGLIGALLVGVSYAKALAAFSEKPLVPVDHVHAHVHGAILGLKEPLSEIFPCIALVVSGGHTNLYYMRDQIHFQLLANTCDDACGECFDKVAKLLGFGYPGGPVIEKLGRKGNAKKFPMPTVFEEKNRLAFSYSGLKTHLANLINQKKATWNEQNIADVCASFQEAALSQIVRKLRRAVEMHSGVKSVLIAGGVAANLRFRELISESVSVKACFPELKYCSDNAAMIAAYAHYKFTADKDSPNWSWALPWDAYSRYNFAEGAAT